MYDLKYARGRLFQTTGLIGTKYLCDALAKTDNGEILLDLLLQRQYPSLGFMLSKGATTVWERWEYMTDNEMNSHCHTPLAAPCKWMICGLAGLSFPKEENGETVFTINPHFSHKLNFVKASLKTARGEIFVHWQRQGEGFLLSVRAPQNCKVKYKNKTYEGGELKLYSV